VRFVVMVRLLARIAGMMMVMRCNTHGIFRKRARAAGAIIRTLGRRLVHDAPNRPCTPPALRAAAQAAIDLAGHARRIGAHHRTNLVVGQDVTGADDHFRCFLVWCHLVSSSNLMHLPFVCKKENQHSSAYFSRGRPRPVGKGARWWPAIRRGGAVARRMSAVAGVVALPGAITTMPWPAAGKVRI
jgi:hypothetical protein